MDAARTGSGARARSEAGRDIVCDAPKDLVVAGGGRQCHGRARLRDGRHPHGVGRPSKLADDSDSDRLRGGTSRSQRAGSADSDRGRLRGRHARWQCGDHKALSQRLSPTRDEWGIRRDRDSRPIARARCSGHAECARHWRFDGGGAHGGPGRGHGQAPARRARGRGRRLCCGAREARLHGDLGCGRGGLRRISQLVLTRAEREAAHRGPRERVGDAARRLQALSQRDEHPYVPRCPAPHHDDAQADRE